MKKHTLLTSLISLCFLAILTGVGAGAGDWKSAGLPKPPYDPTYQYEYSCQLELVSSEDSKGLRHVAETNFVFKSGVENIESLTWIHRIYNASTGEDLVSNEAIPFSTEGHSPYLYFEGGGANPMETDTVGLALSLNQMLEDRYAVTYRERKSFRRTDKYLSLNLSTEARRLDNAPLMNISGYLDCLKVK